MGLYFTGMPRGCTCFLCIRQRVNVFDGLKSVQEVCRILRAERFAFERQERKPNDGVLYAPGKGV